MSYRSLWTNAKCLVSWCLRLNLFGQNGQLNAGSLPHSYFVWLCNEPWCLYVLPHRPQANDPKNKLPYIKQ